MLGGRAAGGDRWARRRIGGRLGLETKAREEMSSNVFARILSSNAARGGAAMDYSDKDGDLVADSPDGSGKAASPPTC